MFAARIIPPAIAQALLVNWSVLANLSSGTDRFCMILMVGAIDWINEIICYFAVAYPEYPQKIAGFIRRYTEEYLFDKISQRMIDLDRHWVRSRSLKSQICGSVQGFSDFPFSIYDWYTKWPIQLQLSIHSWHHFTSLGWIWDWAGFKLYSQHWDLLTSRCR